MSLDNTTLPLRAYHKAKRLIWNPQDLDFSTDRADWQTLSPREHDLIRRALGLFLGGEEAVTNDLAPLTIALRREGGHLEETMFITTQLFEEAKHVEFFAAALDALGEPIPDRAALAGPSYTALFAELERALSTLLTDSSRAAQATAVASYHIVIEGVLAETGYYGIFRALRDRGLLPGLTRGLELVQRDEARHVAFGLHLLSRFIADNPAMRATIEAQLNVLLPLAQGVFLEILSDFMPDVPFGIDLGDLLNYASRQYMARLSVLDRVERGEAVDIEAELNPVAG